MNIYNSFINYNTTLIARNKISFKGENNTDIQIFQKLNDINEDLEALKLVRSLKDVNVPLDEKGNHIVHIVSKKGFYETLRQLLMNPTKARESVNLRGENGATPLAVAGNKKIAKLLLSKGADLYALDDLFRPAGLNPIFDENTRNQIAAKSEAKIESARMQIQKEKINTEPLQQAAAQTTYQKTEEVGKEKAETTKKTVTVSKPKEEKNEKSFFSMFNPKPKPQAESEQAKADVSQLEDVLIKSTPVERQDNIPKMGQEKLPKPQMYTNLSDIKIKGTESFKRIDTPAIQGLDNLVGLENIKNAIRTAIINPVTDEKIQERLGENRTDIPNGILLVSPPGNGKTSLVKAIGAEATMPVFEIRDISEIERLMDRIGDNYRDTNQRAIVYLRGIDKLYESPNSNGELTNLLDRVMSNSSGKGVLTVLSAECTDNIPKTILTPGKVDRIFSFKSPSFTTREEYISRYIKRKAILSKINSDDNIRILADKTHGFSIAQIKHIIDEAVVNSTSEGKNKVELSYLLEKIRIFSKEQNIPEINEYNKTSVYDTALKRYQPSVYDAKDFESIAGMPATKNSVYDAVLKPWKNADKLRAGRIQLPAGAIFAGDLGTSKTYMAKAIARSLNLPLYKLEMSNVGSSYYHETSKRIGEIIDQLVTKFDETGEASILLMDEIDHFQKHENNQAGAEEVNTLLQEIERGRNKILFIGTTNELESLPDSLIRDGRMGTVIHFEHCDKDAAKAIIINMLEERKDNKQVQEILKNKKLLDNISERCNGMVASSVSAIVNDALAESLINDLSLEETINNAVSLRRKKDIEKMLSKNSKNAGHRLNISEDSTIMYDTKYPRICVGERDPKRLTDLGGMQDLKKLLKEEIIDVYQPEMLAVLKENSLPLTKGFILYGPPGNGKTTIVKAVANELGIPLYSLNSGTIGSSLIHQLSKNAQEVRDQLAYKFKMTGERSLVFMDEAQQLVPKTSGSLMTHSHNIEETNFFKDLIMSAEQDGIIYAMATNDLNQIEPAFYENSDRLGVCAYVGNPDYNSRVGIISKMLETRPIAKNLNNENAIKKLAEAFEGFSISKISQTILNTIRDSIKTKQPINLDTTLELIRRSGGRL